MILLNQLNQKTKPLKTPLKIMGYTALAFLTCTGLAFADLGGQVDKASTLVLGKVATLIVGGGTLFGGGYALVQGNISKGLAILGTGALTGLGIALAKSGDLFTLFK